MSNVKSGSVFIKDFEENIDSVKDTDMNECQWHHHYQLSNSLYSDI